jgi:hypothetical protein
MNRRICLALLAVLGCLASPSARTVQSSDVTFTIPLNLTQLSPQIDKVFISCEVMSSAILVNRSKGTGRVTPPWLEFPNTSGQVVTTATFVVPLPFGTVDTTQGASANYVCYLGGHSKMTGQSSGFSDTNADPAFRLSPTPTAIYGNFTW